MKIGAVIAEYNPFHSGHAYQIETYKKQYHADAVVAVMSEDFVQRGEPACTIYENRVRAALACGVDVVIGMPVWFSTASAGVFAAGGVTLLNACGCIDELFFGCDSAHEPGHLLREMTKAASILKNEPDIYKAVLSDQLRLGSHFALARSKALKACGMDSAMFESPNNILGLSYISALKETGSMIRPVLIPRAGSGYHDTDLFCHLPSASAIRHAWHKAGDTDKFIQTVGMPQKAADIYAAHYGKTLPVSLEDFDGMFALSLHEHSNELLKYADMSADLANRMVKYKDQFISVKDYIELISNRSLTKTRVSRAFLHMLLDIDKHLCSFAAVVDHAPYLRILGFKKSAAPVLKEISAHASVPVITKPSEYKKVLSQKACLLYEKDIQVSLLYRMAAAMKFKNQKIPHPFSSGIIIHNDQAAKDTP